MIKKIALGTALAGTFGLGVIAVTMGNAAHTSSTVVASGAALSQEHEGHDHSADEGHELSFNDQQARDIESIVREYLLENPEILVEAIDVYQARVEQTRIAQAKAGATDNLNALLSSDTGYVTGADKANAKVAVIELFDYHCGFCKKASSLVQDLAGKDKDVIVAFREFPILRKESEYAAEAALAARAQGKYLDFHFAMMNASGTLSEDRIKAIAKEQKLNVAKLVDDLGKDDVSNAIGETFRIADQMGVTGTPAFIIATTDGSFVEIVSGYKPDAVLEAVADAKSRTR